MLDLTSEEINRIQRLTTIQVGNKIREIRMQKGLTQTELANLINSDRQYLYKIEKAKVGISVNKLAVIAKALNVPLTTLVDIEL